MKMIQLKEMVQKEMIQNLKKKKEVKERIHNSNTKMMKKMKNNLLNMMIPVYIKIHQKKKI